MKCTLNSNLKLWHLVTFAVVLMLFGGSAIVLADADAVKGFWAPGQIRLASVYSSDGIPITGNTTVKVLSATITIPAGKKADLQTTFSADLRPSVGIGGFAFCFGYFGLDANNPDPGFKPGGVYGYPEQGYEYELFGGATAQEPSALSVSMAGYRKNVAAGTHTVNVYVSSPYSGCTVEASNLNVIANIR